ncbi:MAG: endonuclease/exonuclease/phosphatase family protein [Bacteroidales bacterium]|nr:endonuclease/exonuclease/phosphatase family protein [Bacteroidales bacterium]
MGKKKKKRLPWPVVVFLRLVIVSAAVALLFSYLSAYISPSISSIPLFFGLYFIPLVLLNLLILSAGVIRKAGIIWITFIVLLPSILFAELFIRWGEVKKGDQGIALKVCTYNVGLFSQGRDKSYENTIRDINNFLKQESLSVVCLQEFYAKDSASVTELFPQYPYRYFHLFKSKKGPGFGNLTLSKFPIVNSGSLTFKGSTNLCIFTDIEHYGKRIRFYNTHLESHSISFTSVMKRMRESEKVTEEIYDVHDKLAGTFRKRALQVDSILRHAAATELPSIICGDLNDTPMSYTYTSLTSERKDSFRQSGKGFSATYSFLWPMLRIDYILYPAPIWSTIHKTPRVEFSDHFPVISELIIP